MTGIYFRPGTYDIEYIERVVPPGVFVDFACGSGSAPRHSHDAIPGVGFIWYGPRMRYDSYYTSGYISESTGSHTYHRFIARRVSR